MSNSFNFVFFTTDFPPDFGGLQEYSGRIAAGLGRCGLMAVEAATPANPFSRNEFAGRSVDLRLHAGRSRLGALWSVPVAWRRRQAQAFLHMQWSTAIGSWLLRRLGLGPPYVILVHGAELFDARRPWLNAVKRSVLCNAAQVVAGSRAAADWVRGLGVAESRLRVLHYGCALPASPPHAKTSPASPLRFACLHRLVPRKGTDLLLSALAGLTERAWRLDIAGDGDEKNALLRKTRALGLADRVCFMGVLSEAEKAEFLRDHDWFILPSLPPQVRDNYAEGLGIALLEAQAAGLPVLAARTGGIPEALGDGRTGLLFAAGDVEDLRLKLHWILDHPEVSIPWGLAAAAWVAENFSWERTLEGLAEVMRGAAGRNTV